MRQVDSTARQSYCWPQNLVTGVTLKDCGGAKIVKIDYLSK